MTNSGENGRADAVRVLYSFPFKIGADRICNTAWQQVEHVAAAGADVLVFPGVLHRRFATNVRVQPTLARGGFRIPYRLLGRERALGIHDGIVARRLQRLATSIDIVHAWPVAARETLIAAAEFGIPTVLERPNTHTRYAYESVRTESERLGVALPPDHEHAYNPRILEREEEEYELADRLLCPSDFVRRTFVDRGFPSEKLVRHIYGFDDEVFFPAPDRPSPGAGLTVLFAGVCAVRKGTHFALEAWLRSTAHRDGKLLIAGSFLPDYEKRLAPLLDHPSVRVLGHRRDLPELMRRSDVLVLPSIEEGSALVVSEALGSGCVPLVSEATSGVCTHMENALVHRVGDVRALAEHITAIDENRALLTRLREGALRTAPDITWRAAGARLLDVYRGVIEAAPRTRRPFRARASV